MLFLSWVALMLCVAIYMYASTLLGDLDLVMHDCRLASPSAIALFIEPAACCYFGLALLVFSTLPPFLIL